MKSQTTQFHSDQMAIRRRVAEIMADGRERTAGDLAARVKCRVQPARSAAAHLCDLGLLTREKLRTKRITVYRRAKA